MGGWALRTAGGPERRGQLAGGEVRWPNERDETSPRSVTKLQIKKVHERTERESKGCG